MNNINFPIANDFIPLIKRNRVKTTLVKSGVITQTIQKEEKQGIVLYIKTEGKIKFILGFIYFFSLLFFTLMLFN
jgi:hypothetical protein